METIKVIDLLNKIANGEETPKKFKYKDTGSIYELIEDSTKYDYRNKNNDIFENSVILERLNDELEIMEDTPNKIEKLGLSELYGIEFNEAKYTICRKINEIIDKINGEQNDN